MSPLFGYRGQLYPEYLRHGNACQFIAPTALKFCQGRGLDIGAGRWPLPGADPVELTHGRDGNGLPEGTWDFIFSSHCLEHLVNPATALGHWLRIVKPGGFVVVTIPDEDLYEQGVFPSTFNGDHKFTFTTFKTRSWSTHTVNVLPMLCAIRPPCQVIRVEQILAKYEWEGERRDLTWLTDAECAIEIVLRKPTARDLEQGGRLRG